MEWLLPFWLAANWIFILQYMLIATSYRHCSPESSSSSSSSFMLQSCNICSSLDYIDVSCTVCKSHSESPWLCASDKSLITFPGAENKFTETYTSVWPYHVVTMVPIRSSKIPIVNQFGNTMYCKLWCPCGPMVKRSEL